ncbi:MAG: hypothetical protein IJP38_03370 [Oscillospiraceae bacterium]|nr:hypothetical protein [Oscillospiraceae bacterium]
MNRRISDCLLGKDPNYLYPFLILRDINEDLSVDDIIEEINAIKNSGCGGFLIETRGFTDWGRDKWWELLDIILAEAKKLGMKVWITDDETVPSGKANWAVRDKYPELQRLDLAQNTVDTLGPQKGAAIRISSFMHESETLYTAIAYRVTGSDDEPFYSDAISLTENVRDGILFWDVPEGFYRIFLIFKTKVRGVPTFRDHLDYLSPEACALMISEVYEPHYEHLSKYFGNTISGFFTDEPIFGNMADAKMNYCEKLGSDSILAPWRDDLLSIIAEKEGWSEEETLLALPSLWRDIGGKTASLRRRYMDILTENYSENFVKPIGRWCKEHNVLYTGHILEDMNADMRFGWSTGHFFRSQEGQHTSGFDIVLQQLKVGSFELSHSTISSAKYSDPSFYLYVVGKLAASCAHLYPHMEGRIMCENAGAGGWGEGLSTRKYMLDSSLICGANLFTSAVFDPKHNNNHIPPFVYDHGENPQYPFLRPLMQYLNRVCHLNSSGVHIANALVYYPAEGDWAGAIKLPQKIAAALARAHIDYDFAPWDILGSDAVTIKENEIWINRENFDCLIIPCCEYLPLELLSRFDELAKDVPVIFEDLLPTVSETGEVFEPQYALCLDTEEIPSYLKEKGIYDIALDECPELMHLHLRDGEIDSYLFFNLSASDAIENEIKLKNRGDYILYDAWENKTACGKSADGKIKLRLAPKSTVMLIFGSSIKANEDILLPQICDASFKEIPSGTSVEVTLTNTHGEVVLKKSEVSDSLINYAECLPDFAGTITYKFKLSSDDAIRFIDLGTVGECAELFVNGISCGSIVTSPFAFRVSGFLKKGENEIEVRVASSYGYAKNDDFSKFLTLPPIGILGPIRVG